jgi:hypothetical protein
VVRVPGNIQRSRVRFPALPDFLSSSGYGEGLFSLVSTIEELLGRNSSGCGLEKREYGRADPLRWPHDTFYPQLLALTSPTSGGRSVGIVRLFCLFDCDSFLHHAHVYTPKCTNSLLFSFGLSSDRLRWNLAAFDRVRLLAWLRLLDRRTAS